MRYILLLLLPLVLYAKPFKVASYNVQNLFDMRIDGSEYKEYIPHQHNWNEEILEIKLNHIAEVICDVEADIIGLQEIENSHILARLSKRLQKVGCGYRYSAISHTKGSSIQVALLSNYPIKSQRDIEVGYRVRDILEVDIDLDGTNLKIFVNHFKAKSRDGVESKRVASAKALMSRIMSMPKDREYILLGDFNSDYNEYLNINKKLDDTNGTVAINDTLQTKIEDRLLTKEDMIKNKRGIHYTLWQEITPHNRWSYKFYGKKGSVDNILIGHNMFDGKGIDYINNSFGVYRGSYLFTGKGYINSWEYKNHQHKGRGYSDHLPIYAYFDKKTFEPDTINSNIPTKDIEYLYTIEKLPSPIYLKDIVVVKKIKNNAIIKQTPKGRGVYLFGCADELEEGYRYDIRVDSITTYYGLKEITQIYIKKRNSHIDTSPYYLTQKNLKDIRANEIIKDIEGVYKDGFLYIDGNKIAIHFRKKRDKPKNHTRIKINYAHIGYYNGVNLVIQSKKDFTILE